MGEKDQKNWWQKNVAYNGHVNFCVVWVLYGVLVVFAILVVKFGVLK